MRALIDLIVYDVGGHEARFERYAADMLYVIASGNRLDTDKAERFGKILEDVYRNPFEKAKKLMTASEIKEYLIAKIDKTIKEMGEESNGFNDISGENHVG